MSIDAGSLNRFLTFEDRVGSVDELNQPVLGDWLAAFSTWGSIKGPTGMGSIRGDSSGVPGDLKAYSIRIRYRSLDTIHDGMRIVHNGERFDIKSIRPDFDRREYIDLVCALGGHND